MFPKAITPYDIEVEIIYLYLLSKEMLQRYIILYINFLSIEKKEFLQKL